jgi:Ca2+-binding RTX toxin-like protein
LAVPGSASAVIDPTVNVYSEAAKLELELNGEASDITIGGGSDEVVSFTEHSATGPVIEASPIGGTTCVGSGTREVTCFGPGYPALSITDNSLTDARDTIDASSAPLLISAGAGSPLASPITITGSPFNDFLHGSNLDDEITGGEGHDQLFGHGGADTIDAYDGFSDRIECGDELDSVTADAADELVNCEYPLVVVDGDGDGFTTEEDCDDKDPAIRPGATDVPGNGVDEDCSGGDSLGPAVADLDGDGIQAGPDCNDGDAKIRPGAIEIPGNKVDENCDGVVAPLPPIGSSVLASFQSAGKRTLVTNLTVTDIPKGAKVVLACKGGGHAGGGGGGAGCPFAKVSFSFGSGPRQSTDLSGSFEKRKLKPGVVITVTITAPDTVGKKVRFKTRKGKAPTRKVVALARSPR